MNGNAPVKKFSVGGVSVGIWENESVNKEGFVNNYYSVSIDKRYKDKSGEWKSSNSYKQNDLPKVVLAAQKAFEYLALKEQSNVEQVAE